MTTANGNMAERLTALAASYADESNWRVSSDGNFWSPSTVPQLIMPHVAIELESHRVTAFHGDGNAASPKARQ